MQRSTSKILTTHTGSLPRPRALTQLYALRSRGDAIDAAEIDRAGREAVAAVVRKQRDAGIDIGNNGEQQRDSFFLYLKQRLSGFGGSWERPSRADVDRYPEFKRMWNEQHASKTQVSALGGLPKAIGDVRYLDDRAINDECRDFNAVLKDNSGVFVEPFMSAPSPGIVATAVKNEHYDTLSNYLAALGRALQVEYEAIVRNGLLLQIDAPDLALERHITYKDKPVGEFVAFVEQVVATINQALRNVPRDRVRLHVCWGNSESPHDADVPLEDILPALQQAHVGGFVLPFANPRHAHEFKCFAKRPLKDDQILVAGVIDSLTNFVEHPEVVADRIERVAQVVGDPSRVQAGTDCGFDTSAGWGRVAEDVVWAKFASLRDGARLASERLFRRPS
ncbi:cobalamin-independent methionine synthase II family protein [Rhodoplanes sp. Z2-YC6860]|uniref:cobalamin-independent methionine synthase II family protein n=1 Tax=Rhodoplanes sp. Z2-YC6860 TaxID=674703 RepID=UPI00078D6ACE|nr:cobalamin-independent methionine synthase II family protein [Rhodoplanes sp. Z2-YC6860]AMN38559.1 Methionine synthase, vitamin-B12 independent [Rhodoplanes sp. Z2-YC6860]